MKRHEEATIHVAGMITMKVFHRGAIGELLARGEQLSNAIRLATEQGELIFSQSKHNLVVSSGKALVGDLLIDDESTGITYTAIGTGTTAPALTDTTLATEVARKIITDRVRSGATISLSTFFLASECTYAIKEIGFFGGASASASADSGELFCRILENYDNSAEENDLTFEYSLTIT
jgi:hypothetical protein